MVVLGIVAAVGASCLYNTSIALQALEARDVPREHALRPSLIGRLLRNRRWLVATAVGVIGWPLEITALLLAPLTVVGPCLASGLILLLWLGDAKLGEAPGRREAFAVAAIVTGLAGVAWAAPERTTEHAGTAGIAIALGLLAVPIVAPYVMRRRVAAIGLLPVLSAGCGYAWTSIASKLFSDGLATGAILVALIPLATIAFSEGAALLSEMTALQHRHATHVAPVMFATQVLVPVLLAPLIFGESWSATPLGGAVLALFMAVALVGTVILAGSPAVGSIIESAHTARPD